MKYCCEFHSLNDRNLLCCSQTFTGWCSKQSRASQQEISIIYFFIQAEGEIESSSSMIFLTRQKSLVLFRSIHMVGAHCQEISTLKKVKMWVLNRNNTFCLYFQNLYLLRETVCVEWGFYFFFHMEKKYKSKISSQNIFHNLYLSCIFWARYTIL